MENITADKSNTVLTGPLKDTNSNLDGSLKDKPIQKKPLLSPSNVPPVPPRPAVVKSETSNLDADVSASQGTTKAEISSVVGTNKTSDASFKFSVFDPFHGEDPFSEFTSECEQFNQNGASSSASVTISEKGCSGSQDFDPFCLNKKENKVSSIATTQSPSGWSKSVNNPIYSCVNPVPNGMENRESLYTSVDDIAVDNQTVTNSSEPNSRNISGYLYKQGGLKGNKGWRKRWMVFNGKDIRYFMNSSYQVSKRIVPLTCMEKVNIIEKDSDKKRFKFELVTKFRTFLFAAETSDDRTMWANGLMEAIIHYSPLPEGELEGGDMCNPDMQGYVKFQKEKDFYVAIKLGRLCYYDTEQDFKFASPIHEIEMKLASVKNVAKNKLQISTHYLFVICLVFDSNAECSLWRKMIENAIHIGLEKDNHNLSEVESEPK